MVAAKDARWLIDTKTGQKYAWDKELSERAGFVEVDGDNNPVGAKSVERQPVAPVPEPDKKAKA